MKFIRFPVRGTRNISFTNFAKKMKDLPPSSRDKLAYLGDMRNSFTELLYDKNCAPQLLVRAAKGYLQAIFTIENWKKTIFPSFNGEFRESFEWSFAFASKNSGWEKIDSIYWEMANVILTIVEQNSNICYDLFYGNQGGRTRPHVEAAIACMKESISLLQFLSNVVLNEFTMSVTPITITRQYISALMNYFTGMLLFLQLQVLDADLESNFPILNKICLNIHCLMTAGLSSLENSTDGRNVFELVSPVLTKTMTSLAFGCRGRSLYFRARHLMRTRESAQKDCNLAIGFLEQAIPMIDSAVRICRTRNVFPPNDRGVEVFESYMGQMTEHLEMYKEKNRSFYVLPRISEADVLQKISEDTQVVPVSSVAEDIPTFIPLQPIWQSL
eukprot:TRINITY_DN2463_c0_g1_i1.p1 TRINITY_DN2463_c0_g1~~TRINITY_DN2463_c0_g1_i1.p1  ORF type:complete len:386 (-),score=68.94 TRINITY_DN2463_c0_g1_i1:467-1624(-)